MINHCRYVKKLHTVKTVDEGYEILINQYGNEVEKPFIFCCDDNTTYFLDQHYDEMIDKFIFYNAGERGRITWLQNKDNITDLGIQAHLNCPKKEIVDTGVLPTTLKYPIITKVLASTMGAWKNDVFICNNESELLDAYKKIKSPKLLLQEYINKSGEFCMEGFSINDGQDIFIPYVVDYIRYYNNSYGHYMTVTPFVDKELKSKIQELFKKTKYNGIFEIEFMKGTNAECYFLEINFRAGGWNYAPTFGGGNIPYFWAKSMLLGRIPYEEMNLRMEPFKAMLEPADFRGNVKKIGVRQWIKDLKSTECRYYYNKNDKSPFWHYFIGLFLNKCRRTMRKVFSKK
jgi:D-aspartate ligase